MNLKTEGKTCSCQGIKRVLPKGGSKNMHCICLPGAGYRVKKARILKGPDNAYSAVSQELKKIKIEK